MLHYAKAEFVDDYTRAVLLGLPHQTLMTLIIHKYVTDQLYERDEVRKTV